MTHLGFIAQNVFDNYIVMTQTLPYVNRRQCIVAFVTSESSCCFSQLRVTVITV